MKNSMFAIVLVVMSCLALPISTSHAANDTQNQIKQKLAKLKAIPTTGGAPAQVDNLLTSLIELDPRKAVKYFKIAITKLPCNNYPTLATALTFSAINELNDSDLTNKQIKSRRKKIKQFGATFVPPCPPVSPTA